MRNLKAEAQALAASMGGQLVRVRENRRSRGHWAAWDVHVKDSNARAGRCIVTLIHRLNTPFHA
jgi:hypothetical protein